MMTRPVEAPYTRIAEALNKGERRAWNRLRAELVALADRLREDLRTDDYHGRRVTRLYDLANSLPLLHDDGKGASSSPCELEP